MPDGISHVFLHLDQALLAWIFADLLGFLQIFK